MFFFPVHTDRAVSLVRRMSQLFVIVLGFEAGDICVISVKEGWDEFL